MNNEYITQRARFLDAIASFSAIVLAMSVGALGFLLTIQEHKGADLNADTAIFLQIAFFGFFLTALAAAFRCAHELRSIGFMPMPQSRLIASPRSPIRAPSGLASKKWTPI